MAAKSSSHDRMVCGYLRPAVHKKFNDYAELKGMTKSELVKEAVTHYLNDKVPNNLNKVVGRNHFPE